MHMRLHFRALGKKQTTRVPSEIEARDRSKTEIAMNVAQMQEFNKQRFDFVLYLHTELPSVQPQAVLCKPRSYCTW